MPKTPTAIVMGHTGHGRTTLMSQIRKIGAKMMKFTTGKIQTYEIKLPQGSIAFLEDLSMERTYEVIRQHGTEFIDVAVLVVAADEGVMPDTIKSIDCAREAGIPIVVTINKCDKLNAKPDRVRQELVHCGLTDMFWGGDTRVCNISALMGDGMNRFLELLVLEANA
jgi:translation initiation factor IF-2